MANEKEKKQKSKDGGKNIGRDTLDLISANLYGISPDFLRKNDELVDSTRKILSDKLSPDNQIKGDSKRKNSNLIEYYRVLTSALNERERYEMLNSINENAKYTNPSGSHSVSDDSQYVDTLSDTAVIDELVSGIQNHFSLMPEYAKVCKIIPELDKAVEIIVKDVINRDEFTHKFIINFYKSDEDSIKKSNIEDKIKDLLEEYDFEGKIRKWIKDAEIMGAKPFSILPQDDVVNMLNKEIAKRKGIESLDVTDLISEESLLIKSPLANNYETYDKYRLGLISEESDDIKAIKQSLDSDINPFIDSIITPDIIEDWIDVCTDNLKNLHKSERSKYISSSEDYSEFCNSLENFEKSIKDSKHHFSKETIIKEQLKDLVISLDKSVEVVDPRKGPIYQASKKLKNNNYANHQHDIDKGIIDDFYRVDDNSRNDPSGGKKVKKTFTLDGIDVDISDDPIDINKYNTSIKKKRAILTEYEPEHVIPVSSGGTHVGYYVVEYMRTSSDNFLLLKKDKGSFIDIIRRLGVGEDKTLTANSATTTVDTNNPFNTAAFSPATIMSPVLGGTGGGLGPMGTNSFTNNGDSDKRVTLIKTILIKTIAKRLGDETLVDNGTFQSSLMNLIRDDVLFRNRVRFTFIPESHMVYMNRELDSDGFPKSILDGTLFNCYSYIASLISSLMMKVMKSSDTEVMEVNVGKSKELGLTVGAISQNASTRNISAKTLFSGTESIVRSVGNFKRIIVPVVNGEKLYDVTQVEKVNDVDIDDDFTERALKSVIMKMGVPPTSLDMMSQDEYVASQTQHRLDYRNLIIDKGVNYAKFITKAIKLLVYYSDISIPILNSNKDQFGKNDKKEIEIDISKIEFSFSPPKNLTVTKISEEVGSIMTLVNDILELYYGDIEKETEEWTTMKTLTKRKLMRALSSSTDWSMIDDIMEAAKRETPKIFAELDKFNTPIIDGSDEGGADDDSGSLY